MHSYTDKVYQHFLEPKNVGGMPDPDGVGIIGDPECGDYLRLYIRVNDGGILEDVKFEVYGCPAAVATTSVLTELAKGRSLEEASQITEDDIVLALEGLPHLKLHCSNLGVAALHQAILHYLVRKRECRTETETGSASST